MVFDKVAMKAKVTAKTMELAVFPKDKLEALIEEKRLELGIGEDDWLFIQCGLMVCTLKELGRVR